MSTPVHDTPFVIDGPEFLADPHRHYDRLRREAPVAIGGMSVLPGQQIHFLARYADCVALTTDPRFRRVAPDGTPPALPEALRLLAVDSMILKDDPEHHRLRRLVSRPFTPAAVGRLAERVHAVTGDLLDGFVAGRPVDLQRDYAIPIPVTVISEMVGLGHDERAIFHEGMRLLVDGLSALGMDEAVRRMEDLTGFVRELVARRRATPGEDIMSGLVRASDDGDRLTDDEIVALVFLLVGAGYETTYNLIGNGVLALLRHPDQLALLVRRPELIDTAVEEILRWTGTVGGTKPTYAAEEVEWHGVRIPRGAMVMPLLASANRDPAVFDRPEEFDITRSPNPHIAFSRGAHFCLGANLARMEARIAIGNLLARFPGTRLAVDPADLATEPTPLMVRLRGLPVVPA
ncbi:cytochrome P450 family protein [Pseudonocardia abyssalis]|uniref:Cytochrome P450 n=2 Tax=Pseudonocardia abyssalis TaxID=2792008 RepID=A0ABS6UKA0_9PSEU|nr:cytochrome P450 [Pseudonocardia abyssalis]MBW0132696.1 cytochrome P450 [Pseudonocardia abyssalis]